MNVYGPLKVSVAYLAFTLFLHVFGPWTYADEKLLPVFLFMLAAIAMFSLGYYSIARKWRGAIVKDERKCESNYRRYRSFAKICIVVQLILVVLSFVLDWRDGLLSLGSIFNPGQIYYDALERVGNESSVSITGKISTLISPVIYFSTIFFILNFARINKKWRILLVSTLALQLLYDTLLKGAQKGFFDLGIMVVTVTFIAVFFSRLKYRALLSKGMAILVALVAIFIFFQLSRMDAYGVVYYTGNGTMMLDRDGIFFTLFGDSLGLGLALLVTYLSQGYYGLSLCLQLPFQWTYGLGNSFALTSYAEQYLGVYGIFEGTYPARMEATFGWPAKMYWHTFFPWVASDITFPGTIILMFVIGRVFAKSMWDGIAKGSALGASIFYFMATLIFYLPANNQLMQTRKMMIGFVVLFALWMLGGLILSMQRMRAAR
ncbi:hypothetical protein [Thermomonas haemolytica]|uniref:hypothetical protein n=1 Tax=Thermomonas haemolytica TaxID=141949 RepID=UPI00104A2671|nr:hypothetical protein [Thermomonas haemolytica]